jgi:hypothetical protein
MPKVPEHKPKVVEHKMKEELLGKRQITTLAQCARKVAVYPHQAAVEAGLMHKTAVCRKWVITLWKDHTVNSITTGADTDKK